MALVLGEEKGEQINSTQKLEHESKIIYRHVTVHHTNTSTVRSVVSESQTLLRNVLARYGT